MKPIELKPCPFCGNTTITIIGDRNRGPSPWEIRCCLCNGSVGYYKRKMSAVAAWNRRAALQETNKQEEAK